MCLCCEQNGKLEEVKQTRSSTRLELAEWLNALAHKLGIAKSEHNQDGYLATEENIG